MTLTYPPPAGATPNASNVVMINLSTNQSFYFQYFQNQSPSIQTQIYEDDLPFPYFNSTQTLLTNFGGMTRQITFQFTLNDSSIDLALNPITGVNTNGTGLFQAVYDGNGQVTGSTGEIKYVYPDQVQYLESVFPSSDPSVSFQLSIVDTNYVWENYLGLLTQISIVPNPATRIADVNIQFEQGSNIVSSSSGTV